MNLFQTFFDALKINWKQKPMWKVTLLTYVPLSFVFSILLVPLIIAAGYFYKDTGTLLDNLGSIFFLLLFVVILLINTLISVVCLLASQVGSSIMMQESLANQEGGFKNNKLPAPFLKKIWSGFLYYLIVIGIPGLVIGLGITGSFALMTITENVFMIFVFICILLLSMPMIMLISLLFYTLLPIFILDNLSFRDIFKKSWTYLSSQLGNILLFSLIIYGFLFVISYAINVPLQIFSMMLYFGVMAGMLLLEVSPAIAILLFILIYVAFILFTFLYSGTLYLAMGAIQSGYTLLYSRVQNNYGKEQSLIPAAEANQLAG